MKISRTKNTIRNIIFGTFNKVINIFLPFFSRTVILYVLGAKYLGLNSLFNSILSFLSIAELGVGAAMVYSMYKPISHNDVQTINALLNLYKRLYFYIGLIILMLGSVLIPFLKYIINDKLPDNINIYILYIIYLINVVISYWFLAYKNALIMAFQRNDINSKVSLMITPISYLVMLTILYFTKNYYLYIIWLPIFTIITNILRAKIVNSQFPQYLPSGEVKEEIKLNIEKKVKALIGTKLNTVIINAADNIVMSTFLGLTIIAIYGNYFMIMSSIISFLGLIYSSMLAGLGNSLVTESEEKNYLDFLKFSFMNSWLVGWCSICLYCLYQPFMKLWVGEKYMFKQIIVIEFVVYFFIYQIRKIPIVYKDAAGIWWEDRFRPYICMTVNLILNITLVQIIGVSGIILSTVFSLIISIIWENYTIFKYIFHRSSKKYYKNMTNYLIKILISGFICYYICHLFNENKINFIIRFLICLIIPNIVFYLLNYYNAECKSTIVFIKNVLKRNEI